MNAAKAQVHIIATFKQRLSTTKDHANNMAGGGESSAVALKKLMRPTGIQRPPLFTFFLIKLWMA
jgi:hypothetical protein